ncbi:carboxylesterase/lipase family protein [Burkholderia cenocepacia]|uniref:carboxylesterase/lipase family protein n=1 Tax=Burkholderia cenocepacia TaxID=95486 RepID=UPI002010FFBC|nr:carboxylesterase family protein [Burkholderia cenocepacia]MDI9700213.1 carboxylesterase family protein [Burkholderia cenocepacia]MDN7624765.1 carboxylesterase family protein [Burkholderia cenocepacia]MDN7643276.1 carboxylesterase family protein [Burkholderia cenocepacia]
MTAMISRKHNPLKKAKACASPMHDSGRRLPVLFVSSTLAVLLSGCGGDGSSVTSDPTIAVTADGAVQGTLNNGVIAFKGIPFAAPPVGDLRWRPPQPVAAWSGVRQATSFVHDCMQTSGPNATLTVTPSEDCLYLNVWRPQSGNGKNLPVMVWIYGGAYVIGGTSMPTYDGTQFARQGVVIVTVNYRLGRFGFFAHPAVTAVAAQSGEMLANYGYMDQIAALKWVQRNIANFGGDPANVTLFGESAGGESVHNLLTSPQASGLFAKAIVESGNGRVNQYFGRTLSRNAKTVGASAEEQGSAFAAGFGITGSDVRSLHALRALSADQVLDGLDTTTLNTAHSLATFSGSSIIDGKLVVDEPENQYKAGQFAKVPLLLGVNNADLGFATRGLTTKEQAYAIFGQQNLSAAAAAFDPTGTASVSTVENQIARVITMDEPARFVARTFTARGVPTYLYRFSYVAQSIRGKVSGATHAAEIPYVFDTLSAAYGTAVASQDEQVAHDMIAYWTAFARTGNPSDAGLIAWPMYNADLDNQLAFTSAGTLSVDQPNPLKAQIDLVEPLNDTDQTANRQYQP